MKTKKVITREQVNHIIKKYKIKIGNGTESFKIRKDGLIDVKGSVNISAYKIFKLPLKFGNVSGDFICKSIGLKTLYGAPCFVGGNFVCSDNELISLVYGPGYVGGNYFCQENNLVNLQGSPIEIIGRFNCALNKLESLIYGPKRVGKSYFANHNQIVSLQGCAKYIGGSLHIEANLLNNLCYCPDYIGCVLHLDCWMPSLYMGMKNCNVKSVKIEKLERMKDDNQILPESIITHKKCLPILFKYNSYLEIWNNDRSINIENLNDALFEIYDGLL